MQQARPYLARAPVQEIKSVTAAMNKVPCYGPHVNVFRNKTDGEDQG